MKTLYTHRVYNLSGQPTEAVIDMSKVTAIQRTGGMIAVHMQGTRAALTLHEMPDTKDINSPVEYNAATERAYNALVEAWKGVK